MVFSVDKLACTPSARWSVSARQRRTRLLYYEALATTLEHLLRSEGPWRLTTRRVTQREVLDQPGGPALAKSTFNSLFGRNATSALVSAIGDELAAPYTDDLGRCAAELRVHTYQPYRDEWLTSLCAADDLSRRQATVLLVRAVADWARHNPAVAMYLDHVPPLVAVEDLVVLSRAPLGPADAAVFLGQAARLATNGDRPLADVVADVCDELLAAAFDVVATLSGVLDELRDRLATVTRIGEKLPAQARDELARQLTPAFADVLAALRPSA
jgi:hypothetical protein